MNHSTSVVWGVGCSQQPTPDGGFNYVHYYPKPMGGSQQNPIVDGHVGIMISRLINKNDRSLKYVPISLNRLDCLMFRQRAGCRCHVTSCTRHSWKLPLYTSFQWVIFKRYFSQSHFSIDKRFGLCRTKCTTFWKPSLSEGGGGWRKTFKVFPIKMLNPRQKFRPISLSDL